MKNVDVRSNLTTIFSENSSKKGAETDEIFIDRDGEIFSEILNYFRDENYFLPRSKETLSKILLESKYFGFDRLTNELENVLNRSNETIRLRLVWNEQFAGELVEFLGPMKFFRIFNVRNLTKKFFDLISTNFPLEKLICRATILDDDPTMIRCQPIDKLEQLVAAKIGKHLQMIVSYSNEFIYFPVENSRISSDQMETVLNKLFDARCEQRTVQNEQRIEFWSLLEKTSALH